MTADVLGAWRASADADDTIRRAVQALIRGRGLKVEDVAPAVAMSPATLYRRLAGHGRQQAFAGGEIAALALYFGVPVNDLYDGLGGRFLPPPNGGSGTELPHLDSDQEPTGNRLGLAETLADVLTLPRRRRHPNSASPVLIKQRSIAS